MSCAVCYQNQVLDWLQVWGGGSWSHFPGVLGREAAGLSHSEGLWGNQLGGQLQLPREWDLEGSNGVSTKGVSQCLLAPDVRAAGWQSQNQEGLA